MSNLPACEASPLNVIVLRTHPCDPVDKSVDGCMDVKDVDGKFDVETI